MLRDEAVEQVDRFLDLPRAAQRFPERGLDVDAAPPQPDGSSQVKDGGLHVVQFERDEPAVGQGVPHRAVGRDGAVVRDPRLDQSVHLGQGQPSVHPGPGEPGREDRADREVARRVGVAFLVEVAEAEREPGPEPLRAERGGLDQRRFGAVGLMSGEERRSEEIVIPAGGREDRVAAPAVGVGSIQLAEPGEVVRPVVVEGHRRVRVDLLGPVEPGDRLLGGPPLFGSGVGPVREVNPGAGDQQDHLG